MEPAMESGAGGVGGGEPLGAVVQIDDGQIRAHLDEVVRATVEETLNALLDAEADQLCGARKYERTEGRKDTRAGSYDRQLHTKAGEVTLQVQKLRSLPFETAIIERYRRRETSVEEALIEMYLAGVSVRRVEDITQALWGTRVSASTASDLNQRSYYKPAARTLALPAHQQPAGTPDARDPAANSRGRGLPRRQLGTDAGRRQTQACGFNQMGQQTLPPDESAGRSPGHRLTFCSGPFEGGPEQNHLNPTTLKSHDSNRKCEKVWTLLSLPPENVSLSELL